MQLIGVRTWLKTKHLFGDTLSHFGSCARRVIVLLLVCVPATAKVPTEKEMHPQTQGRLEPK